MVSRRFREAEKTSSILVSPSDESVRLSKNWLRMSEIYRRFGGESPNLDYSDVSARDMYLYETRGEGDLSRKLFETEKENGYAVGKKWMNVQIELWKQDIRRGILFKYELEDYYPKWFLDKFLNVQQGFPLNKDQIREGIT